MVEELNDDMNHSSADWQIGQVIEASYKTGHYLGKVVKVQPPKLLMEVAAVIIHPTQGDLHHPFAVDVPLFHQRRALAHREKVWVPMTHTRACGDELPSYQESLLQALDHQVRALQGKPSTDYPEWSSRSLEELRQLRAEYFPSEEKGEGK
jgi:kinase-associated protein B